MKKGTRKITARSTIPHRLIAQRLARLSAGALARMSLRSSLLAGASHRGVAWHMLRWRCFAAVLDRGGVWRLREASHRMSSCLSLMACGWAAWAYVGFVFDASSTCLLEVASKPAKVHHARTSD